MKRFVVLAAAATLLAVAPAAVSAPKQVCVGGPGCYPTLAAALAVAGDGATVRVNPGTYAGGVAITHSITLQGAGAASTRIQGGGPVLTIGQWDAQTEPTVTVSGVTISGGLTTSIPAADSFQGIVGIQAYGGGVLIPPSSGFGPGATVTIANSVISGNTAASTATWAPASLADWPGWPACPGLVPCPYSGSSGGGIASFGNLTVSGSTVSGNQAGGVASDADGGGIQAFQGSLTLVGSTVTGNSAKALVPNGRYAEGGGVFAGDGTSLSIRSSSISGNATQLQSTFSFFVGGGQTLDMNSNGGGIHIGGHVDATVEDTHVDHNSIAVSDPNGEPLAFDSGLCLCTDDQASSTLTMRNSTVSGNSLDMTVASQADVFPGSGDALELDGPGTVSNTQVVGNSVVVRATSGDAIATNGVAIADAGPQVVISNSVISGNTTTASAPHGTAQVVGGGLMNQGPLLLKNSLVSRNRSTVSGLTEIAQGGGIFNGPTWFQGGPLTLQNSAVTLNVLAGDSGATLQGGGIFTLDPATTTLANSTVNHNTPDDCFGSSC